MRSEFSSNTSMSVQTVVLCVCVCVVFLFILDVRLVDVPAGVTQDFSSTSWGASLNFSREKDSAVPFPRRP